MQVDATLERPSMTVGQTDVDRCSEEQETSRLEQHHDTDPTPDAAAVRWTDTAASMSTNHQPHHGAAVEQEGTSTTDGQTVVD